MSNPSYTSKETLADGTPVSIEHMMFQEFDPNQLEELRILKENGKRLFAPKFIPYYPRLSTYGLTPLEVVIFGFIDYYLPRSGNEKFYFTNEDIATMLNCSQDTVSKAINRLAKLELIISKRKMRANGGQIRFVTMNPEFNYENLSSRFYGNSLDSTKENHGNNKNKINKNKINNTIVSIDTSKNARTKERNLELINYYEEVIGTKLEGSSQDNWRYCTHLVNRLSAAFPQTDPIESTKRLIDAATKDEFHAKNANSFKYLFGNYLKIIKSHQSKLQSVAII